MKHLAGLNAVRLEKDVAGARPLDSLELGSPAVRASFVSPVVAAWRRHLDVLDFAIGVQAVELKMNILDVAGLELLAWSHVIVAVLTDPARFNRADERPD